MEFWAENMNKFSQLEVMRNMRQQIQNCNETGYRNAFASEEIWTLVDVNWNVMFEILVYWSYNHAKNITDASETIAILHKLKGSLSVKGQWNRRKNWWKAISPLHVLGSSSSSFPDRQSSSPSQSHRNGTHRLLLHWYMWLGSGHLWLAEMIRNIDLSDESDRTNYRLTPLNNSNLA